MSIKGGELRPVDGENSPLLRADNRTINQDENPTVSLGRTRNTSSLMTFVNIIKAYIASGFMLMPFYFKNAGLIGGTVMIVILAILCAVTTWYLVQTKLRLEHYGVYTYTDVAAHAVGPKFAAYVTFSLILAQCGFCIAYTVYTIENIGAFFPDTDKWLKSGVISACYGIVAFGLMLIRTHQVLGVIGMISNVCFYTGIIGIMVMTSYDLATGDPVTSGPLHVYQGQNSSSDAKYFGTAITTILAFGQVVYSYEGIGVILPAQAAILNTNHFMPIIVAILIICAILFCTFGMLNYVAYAGDTKYEITDNIDDWAKDMDEYRGEPHWVTLAKAVRILLVIAIGGTYGHQMFPVTDLIDEFVDKSFSRVNAQVRFLGVRASIAMATSLLAYIVPSFDFILELVGSVGSTPLQFVVPCVVYYVTFRDKLSFLGKAAALGLASFGTVAGVTCCVLSILAEAGVVSKAA